LGREQWRHYQPLGGGMKEFIYLYPMIQSGLKWAVLEMFLRNDWLRWRQPRVARGGFSTGQRSDAHAQHAWILGLGDLSI